jgi:hypothetical protein
MQYKIEFQYKPKRSPRPLDFIQEVPIESDAGYDVPTPSMGDSVVIDLEGKAKAYKVLTRHFHYTRDFCTVSIAVTDLDPNRPWCKSRFRSRERVTVKINNSNGATLESTTSGGL